MTPRNFFLVDQRAPGLMLNYNIESCTPRCLYIDTKHWASHLTNAKQASKQILNEEIKT